MAHTEYFEVIGKIGDIKIMATGSSIRALRRLRKTYGAGRWRKLNGVAKVRLTDASTCHADLHCYESHGVGKKALLISA